jgi:hypothetical protein
MRLAVCAVLMAAVLYGCGPATLIKPEPQKSALGMALTIRTPVTFLEPIGGFIHPTSLTVYFVRVGEGADPFAQAELIESNLVYGDYAYLLNAGPGRYAAVAAMAWHKTGENDSFGNEMMGYHIIYFPKEMIERSMVSVGPDGAGFMGDFWVAQPPFGEMPEVVDEAQSHYHRILMELLEAQGGVKDDAPLKKRVRYQLPGIAVYGAKMMDISDWSEEAGVKFLKRSVRYLMGTGWDTLMQRELERQGK